jgi:hypothetical protein
MLILSYAAIYNIFPGEYIFFCLVTPWEYIFLSLITQKINFITLIIMNWKKSIKYKLLIHIICLANRRKNRKRLLNLLHELAMLEFPTCSAGRCGVSGAREA